MGMLDRYKKAGGFVQLLNLIETCGPQKQEKFLAMIREEDPAWEEAIRKRTLSIQRIFSWNSAAIAEVISRIQPLTLATAIHGLSQEQTEQAFKALGYSQKRVIEELLGTTNPTPAEISSGYMKIINEVRGMLTTGVLRPDKVDPELHIDDNIEEKIANSFSGVIYESGENQNTDITPQHSETHHASSSAQQDDLESLRRKLHAMHAENSSLRKEVKSLRDKLDQIRKIA